MNDKAHDPDFPERFLEFMRSGWHDPALEVARHPAADRYAERRQRISAAFPGETLVIPAGTDKVRANDTDYRFRPGSDLTWLTGARDPDVVLVLRPVGGSHEATLYLRPRSPRDTDEFFRDRRYGELWIGRRPTLREAADELGVATESLDRLGEVLDDCAPGRTQVLRGLDSTVDAAVRPRETETLGQVLSELRLVKDDWEVAQLRAAVDATVRGFEDVARILPADRPVRERLLEGVFSLRARHDGNDVGYSSIVGNGSHGAILHWVRNEGATRPGDLLLMDMGVEATSYYTADVTRTLPVSGAFTPLQREVYDTVYRAQQAGLDILKPGVEFQDVHLTCMRVLAEGLHDLKVLPVSVDEAMDPECTFYRRWSLHGFGHMLGLDVHDCAASREEVYRKGTIEAGYVITVEPGLYFQPEDELVPAELRGIGIRIEDDVLVTPAGPTVLSDGLPRTATDVEQWLATQRDAGPRLPS